MNQYAYVRVSSKEQKIDRQMDALESFALPKTHVYCDRQSGKDFNRPAYKKLLRKIKPGDLIIIKSIDRLGRNYNEVLEQWRYITKEKKADIVVLDMSLLDTRTKQGDLTGALITDMVLQILAYVAQKEREFIHQRQAEGIAAAKRRGTKLGRKEKKMPDNFEAVCEQCFSGEVTIREAAGKLGIAHMTFYRRYKKRIEEQALLHR